MTDAPHPAAALMEAPVAEGSDGSLHAGVPRTLFPVSRFRFNPFHADYVVEPDDDHFLFGEPAAAPTAQDHLTVVLDWFQELGHAESAAGR